MNTSAAQVEQCRRLKLYTLVGSAVHPRRAGCTVHFLSVKCCYTRKREYNKEVKKFDQLPSDPQAAQSGAQQNADRTKLRLLPDDRYTGPPSGRGARFALSIA